MLLVESADVDLNWKYEKGLLDLESGINTYSRRFLICIGIMYFYCTRVRARFVEGFNELYI